MQPKENGTHFFFWEKSSQVKNERFTKFHDESQQIIQIELKRSCKQMTNQI